MSAQKKRSKRNSRKQKEPNLGQKQAEERQRSESNLSHMGESSRSNTQGSKCK
jgi:hypothetical protein